MRHRALTRLLVAVLCLLLSVQVLAAETVDTQRLCSLTLRYTHNGEGLRDLEIGLWRVGDVFADGTYALTAPYSVEIQGITAEAEWRDTAATLSAYLTADGVKPHHTAVTDASGTAVFSDLPVGLYLVRGMRVPVGTGVWEFDDFLMFLPRSEGGEHVYDVDSHPKHAVFNTGETREYTVWKLWKDTDSGIIRPASIHIDIHKDGVHDVSVELSAENNWHYSWTAPAIHDFTVVERNVPDGYAVLVSENDTAFVVVNTIPETPDIPQTGDSAPILLYILLLSLSGLGLILLGILALRRKSHEER